MASMASFTMAAALPPPSTTSRRLPVLAGSPPKTAFHSSTPPLPNKSSLQVRASSGKEQVVAGLTAAAVAAAFVIPEVAEAAQPGLSPSLKNFLLSIVSGGVVLAALLGAVIGVSNFDPVKRA